MQAEPRWGRILEIGRTSCFSQLYPQHTTWVRTGAPLAHGNTEPSARVGVLTVLSLLRELRRGGFGLVILPAVDIRYGHDARFGKRLLRRVLALLAKSDAVGRMASAWLHLDRAAVAIVDYSDDVRVSYETCALVPRFRAYFKRELYPNQSLRRGERYEQFNGRVHAVTLPLPDETAPIPSDAEKTTDVFFSGGLHGPVREQGIAELHQLAREGYAVDVSAGALSYAEYLQRMSVSRIVWSPEGFGWDCYRHYEAAFCGAVPLINTPRDARALPFEDRVHCLYYDPQPGVLSVAVKRALQDPPALRQIAAAARELVLTKHTRRAIAEYIERVVAES